jgi:hypothetical protein
MIGVLVGCSPSPRDRALDSITQADLKRHLDILAADEFRGRDTPSPELKIASRYLAVWAESYGLQPLLPDGSYLQAIPLRVTEVDSARTEVVFRSSRGNREFAYLRDFGLLGRGLSSAQASGRIFFLGLGLSAPDLGWDDIGELDLEGSIVILLDPELPETHNLMTPENRRLVRRRTWSALQKGAAAVLTVISEGREEALKEADLGFSPARDVALGSVQRSGVVPAARQRSTLRAEVRHDMAAFLLGISQQELGAMFAELREGNRVPARATRGGRLDIRIETQERADTTFNVVAWMEGADERLKEEYVLVGSHHDHLGVRGGRVLNGADDNGSGTVAMLEIAQALSLANPKRSVVLVWHTAEEKGLWGARFFMENSPIPVEKISAQINLDMISRNDPDSVYLIGSKILSSELDEALHFVNAQDSRLGFDYAYEDPSHPDRFFFRSDHYPYIRHGIPAVWLFCGTTEDYHQETDTISRVDFEKMVRITRLAFGSILYIGNLPDPLALDAHPDITTRGSHNTKIAWR